MSVRVDGQGRIVLPAAVRDRFHWAPGSRLSLRVDDTGVHLLDRRAVLAQISALGSRLRDRGYTVEQFLADKAEEAEEEAAGEQAPGR